MDPLLHAALRARQQGHLAEAASLTEAWLARAPGDAQAWMLLAELRRGQQLPTAGEAYDRVLTLQPGLLPARYGRAQWLDAQGRLAEAAAAYADVAARSPGAAEVHFNLARMHWALGEVAACRSALAAAQAALSSTLNAVAPSTPTPSAAALLAAQVQQLAAQVLESEGNPAAAGRCLDEAVRLAPSRASAWHDRGAWHMRQGHAAEALANLDEALVLGADGPDSHYVRGNALQAVGRLADAEAAYRCALQRHPLHELALYDLARLRWRLGHADWASELEDLAATEPGSALPCGLLGRLRLNAGDHQGAIEAYEEGLRRAPGTSGFLDGLAQARSRVGEAEAAIALHQAACAAEPARADPLVNLAATCLRLGRTAAAEQAAQAALALDPQHQVAWAYLGSAWRAQGDPRSDWLHDYTRHIVVEDLPPPPGWTSAADFNEALRQWLDGQHHDRREPIDQTLRQGTQTVGNLFDRPDAMAQTLKAQVLAAVQRYVDGLRALPADPAHPLLSRVRSRNWRITDSWSSRLRRQGHHTFHAHGHGWISACYYVEVPASVQAGSDPAGAEAGCIAFGQPDVTVGQRSLAPLRVVRPSPGRLALFPSSMWHGTLPFDDDAVRLTVAFDVVPADA